MENTDMSEFSEKEKYYKNLVGHECLEKDDYHSDYYEVQILGVKAGIVKMLYGNSVLYRDLSSCADPDYIRINPFESKSDVSSSKVCDKKMEKDSASQFVNHDGYIYISDQSKIIEEQRKRCNEGQHDWQYMEYLTYPGIKARTCRGCGRQEEQDRDGNWIKTK